MRTYRYPAVIEPGDRGGFVVSFPDVPEAITEGDDRTEAEVMAADALGVALLTYIEASRAIPAPTAVSGDQVLISVDPEICAKLAVIESFRESGLTQAELARRLGKDAREIRRILDPDHATKLGALTTTLTVLGRRLVIGVEAA